MDRSALKIKIFSAFDAAIMPTVDQVAPHRCEECDEIANAFGSKTVDQVSEQIVDDFCWSLPLFSACAKRYFLPAWLVRSIDNPDTDFTDALLYNLDSDHRNDGYSDEQRVALVEYLIFIRRHVDGSLSNHLESAMKRWR